MSSQSPHSSRLTPRAAPPGIAWSDLTAAWVWPRLLLTPLLAARVAPVCLGILAIAAIDGVNAALWAFGLLPRSFSPVDAAVAEWIVHLRSVGSAMRSVDHIAAATAISDMIVTVPRHQFSSHPWGTALSWLSAVAAIAIASAGIARAAALASGSHAQQPIHTLVKFSLARILSCACALLLPWLIVAACLMAVACAGWVLLSFPYVQVVGAGIVGILGIPAGIAIAFLAVAAVVGTPLMIPAIAAEGADALDAVQRVLAYVRAAFIRLFVYWAIAAAVLAAVFFFAYTFGSLVSMVVHDATTRLVDPAAFGGTSGPLTSSILNFWEYIIALIIRGYLLAAFVTASTLVYLAVRRVVDGQDMGEIWIESQGPGIRIDDPDQRGSDDE